MTTLIINGVDFTDMLTPFEVAALFRVHIKTVGQWAEGGKLTSVRTPGGHRRFSRVEVHALLAGGTR